MPRFRAVVELAGGNPYVAVPARVNGELAPYAVAGRIRVTGRCASTPFG